MPGSEQGSRPETTLTVLKRPGREDSRAEECLMEKGEEKQGRGGTLPARGRVYVQEGVNSAEVERANKF